MRAKHVCPRRLRDAVRRLRERCDWTQQQMADRLGFDRTLIPKWEAGKRRPTPEQCWAMAQAAAEHGADDLRRVFFSAALNAHPLLAAGLSLELLSAASDAIEGLLAISKRLPPDDPDAWRAARALNQIFDLAQLLHPGYLAGLTPEGKQDAEVTN